MTQEMAADSTALDHVVHAAAHRQRRLVIGWHVWRGRGYVSMKSYLISPGGVLLRDSITQIHVVSPLAAALEIGARKARQALDAEGYR